MNELTKLVNTPVVKDQGGATVISMGHIIAIAVGVIGLYLMIPERKRKTLFK